jgi:hypothetical protein
MASRAAFVEVGYGGQAQPGVESHLCELHEGGGFGERSSIGFLVCRG